MPMEFYWIDGPWPGKLAIAPRPRGGDWLDDEIAAWHRSGIDSVVSLLTSDEEEGLELGKEAATARAENLNFISYPIPDRQVPASPTDLASLLEQLNADLCGGKGVVIHCRQGIGRSGLVAACLLTAKGLDPALAVERVSKARGVQVPETREQRQWIDHYAASLTGAK